MFLYARASPALFSSAFAWTLLSFSVSTALMYPGGVVHAVCQFVGINERRPDLGYQADKRYLAG